MFKFRTESVFSAQVGFEGSSITVLEDDVESVIVLINFIHFYNVGVVQLLKYADLPFEKLSIHLEVHF